MLGVVDLLSQYLHVSGCGMGSPYRLKTLKIRKVVASFFTAAGIPDSWDSGKGRQRLTVATQGTLLLL